MHFLTDRGKRVPAVTAGEMRDVDQVAIRELGPNLYQMMENAGRSLAMRVLERLDRGGVTGTVLVLAGSGGNGGGGICCARHLANHDVSVHLCLSAPEALEDVTSWQLHVFESTPGARVQPDELRWENYAIIVDALIGYGLRGLPRDTAADLIRGANASCRYIIALDVPSGIDATTAAAALAIDADETLTLALPKTGLVSSHAGAIFLADIGIPLGVYRRLAIPYVTPFDGRSIVPLSVFDSGTNGA